MRQPKQRDAQEFYEEHESEYVEAKAEAFREYTKDLFKESLENYLDDNDGDGDVLDFADFLYDAINDYDNTPDEFSFPDKEEWLASEYESMLDDYADQAYEEEKDRRLGF